MQIMLLQLAKEV